jgi:LPXTG-site transpeptidase (sortase) family protein
MQSKRTALALFSSLIILAMLAAPALAAQGDTIRISVSSAGDQATNNSDHPRISSDGDYIVFSSNASNLVSGDTNASSDIFRRRVSTGETQIASLRYNGTISNGYNSSPDISSNGRYITFESTSTNMVTGDTNGESDIFRRDMNTGSIQIVSVYYGAEGQSNGESSYPAISTDGNRIAFESVATNLVEGDTNSYQDIFVRDLLEDTTIRVSVDNDGHQANGNSYNADISDDGDSVVFESEATNLVENDTNDSLDVFLHSGNTTYRVSVDGNGNEVNGASYNARISSDGRYVVFSSEATNLVSGDLNGVADIFEYDTQEGTTTRVSVSSETDEANGPSGYPDVSSDGRYIVFQSDATNLVHNDTNTRRDIFMHDMTTGMTTRVSMGTGGIQGGLLSTGSSVSSNGTYVAFNSISSNLVANDTNGRYDIFRNETDRTVPTVTFGVGSIPGSSGGNVTTNPSTLTVMFSENVMANGTQYGADSAWNYMLVRPGPNNVFDTTTSAGGICDSDHVAEGDDERVYIEDVTYNSTTHIATLVFEQQATPLANGRYQLFVCGMASVSDLAGNVLNTRANTGVPFTVGPGGPGGGTGGGSGSATTAYPATGFAPGRVTSLPAQTVNYAGVDDMLLNIPSLGVQMPVVEVPKENGTWDVSWLGAKAGWLDGSAFPTWEGNSVLTGHVYDVNGQPGPFVSLAKLKWGDKVIVHAWGQEYTYEVRSVEENVNPKDTRLLTKHEELPWLTLVTCHGYDEAKDTYLWRTVVRAVQIGVK